MVQIRIGPRRGSQVRGSNYVCSPDSSPETVYVRCPMCGYGRNVFDSEEAHGCPGLEITAVLGGSLYRAVEINIRSQDQFNRDLHTRETEESEVCIL